MQLTVSKLLPMAGGLVALSSAGLAQTETIDASEALALAPSGAWQAQYEEGACRLSRMFGAEGNQHVLQVQQVAPDDEVNLTLAGPQLAGFVAGQTAEISWSSQIEPIEHFAETATLPTYGSALFLPKVRPGAAPDPDAEPEMFPEQSVAIDIEEARGIKFLKVEQGDAAIHLKTGPMLQALQVLNECTMHILAGWGLDPERHKTMSQPVRLQHLDRLARRVQENYPSDSLLRGEQGNVGVAVLVDAEGVVQRCIVTSDSGYERLNTAACRGMRLAKYEPALDGDGNPMDSYFATLITYRVS